MDRFDLIENLVKASTPVHSYELKKEGGRIWIKIVWKKGQDEIIQYESDDLLTLEMLPLSMVVRIAEQIIWKYIRFKMDNVIDDMKDFINSDKNP